MSDQNDVVQQLRMVLQKLARDPRASAFRVAEPLTLLDAAIHELTRRQADIAVSLLVVDRAAGYPLSDDRRQRLACYVGAFDSSWSGHDDAG